eukprot:TRINITY_DN6034_c0_g1_i2.p1 TRINITY_DN6034_c0_g1~~TRINITY_DN6034_c0_g1_i2.p1  ORF type:complete len:495 (+),score=68.20 TRINITY_DN6034_c0_g1_i2:18-1502(+)
MKGTREMEHRAGLRKREEQLNITSLDCWYKITVADVKSRGGGMLLNYYGNSLQKVLEVVYPDHEWISWKFKNCSSGFWKSIDNRREFIMWVGSEIGICDLDDWYKVNQSDLKKYHVSGMLSYHASSLVHALVSLFHEHPWDLTKFSRFPRSHWALKENRKNYVDTLAKKLGISEPSGWYQVSLEDIRREPGLRSLLDHYSGSLFSALEDLYPDHNWKFYKFKTVPKNFWLSIQNQRNFFDNLAGTLGISKPEDWYTVSYKDIVANGGGGLMQRHKNSPYSVLSAVYPEYSWKPFLFLSISRSTSKDPEILESFMAYAKEKLQIQDIDDWSRVSGEQIRSLGGSQIVRHNGGWNKLLTRLYPDRNWDTKMKPFQKRAWQRWLLLVLRDLLPIGTEINEEYTHPTLKFLDSTKRSRAHMKFDIFVPSLNLALEYQGRQHYSDVEFFGSHVTYRARDEEKVEACKQGGITLVSVPSWWDGKQESLITILKAEGVLLQ